MAYWVAYQGVGAREAGELAAASRSPVLQPKLLVGQAHVGASGGPVSHSAPALCPERELRGMWEARG